MENRTSSRKTRVGLVVSDKMDKTVVVAIADRVAHDVLLVPLSHRRQLGPRSHIISFAYDGLLAKLYGLLECHPLRCAKLGGLLEGHSRRHILTKDYGLLDGHTTPILQLRRGLIDLGQEVIVEVVAREEQRDNDNV